MFPKHMWEPEERAFWTLVLVTAMAAVAVWAARLFYLAHRNPAFNPLTPEQIRRRKRAYDLVRALAGLAILGAALAFCHSCGY